MTKTDWKFFIDVMMFLAVTGVILVGLLLAFVLKEGPVLKESEKFFLGLHRHQWGGIHSILSLSFAVFLVFHLCLEWSWIKGKSRMIFKRFWRPALGMIGSAALFIPIVFFAGTDRDDPRYLQYGFAAGEWRGTVENARTDRLLPLDASSGNPPLIKQEAQSAVPSYVVKEGETTHDVKSVSGTLGSEQANFIITGRMTLSQIEKETGVPAGRILIRMGLPSDISRNETLGRLRRLYGFSIPDLRAAIDSLIK